MSRTPVRVWSRRLRRRGSPTWSTRTVIVWWLRNGITVRNAMVDPPRVGGDGFRAPRVHDKRVDRNW